MGGKEAVRGFRHQFLWALEAALRGLELPTGRIDAIRVESTDDDTADFVLMRGSRRVLAVQAKSGINAAYSFPDAIKELLSLIRTEADAYQLLTNRAITAPLRELADLLDRHPGSDALRTVLFRLAKPDHPAGVVLRRLDDESWQRLANCRISVDLRDRTELLASIRERARVLRRRFYADREGSWELAGLLTGHLLSYLEERATTTGTQTVALNDITAELGIELGALIAVTARRTWSVHVNTPPRLGDVARHAALAEIAATLHQGVTAMQVPICVLSGLSGIGKSSLAAAWAADRADSYDAVFWVDAANASTLAASFQGIEQWCAKVWALDSPGSEVRDRVLASLVASARPWLMVFDNAVDQRQVSRWLPTAGLGEVIITTTDQAAWHGALVTRLVIGPMAPAEAVELMTRRLDGTHPSSHDDPQLRELARYLHHWPLALELACAYMNTCLGGFAGLASYRRLVPRSLDDEDSVPVDYPVTLVRAILLLWQRMTQGGEPGSAGDAAHRALRFAAYLHPGQIPLHLIMACIMFEPEAIAEANISGPFPVPQRTIPLAEVARALTRYGLATVDAPLDWGPEPEPSPESITFTVSMNEIVQLVLREQTNRDGLTEPVTYQLAFHLQNWIVGLLEANRYDLALPLAPHAYQASDLCLILEQPNAAIALLWGNTAGLLAYLDDWPKAAAYLRAELDWLHGQSGAEILFVKTAHMLIQTLISNSDWPSGANEVSDLLEEIALRSSAALRADEAGTMPAIEHVLAMIRTVLDQMPDPARTVSLLSSLQSAVPLDEQGRARSGPGRAAMVDDLIANQQLAEAEAAALDLLAEADPLMAAGLLKALAELRAQERRWGAVAEALDAIRGAIGRHAMPIRTLALVAQNVTLPCLGYLHQPGAEWALNEISHMTTEFIQQGRTFRPEEVFYIDICRATCAALRGDPALATLLPGDTPRNLRTRGEAGTRVWVDIKDLLVRWAGEVAVRPGSPPQPTIALPRRPGPDVVGDDTSGLPPGVLDSDAVALFGVLMAQTELLQPDEVDSLSACRELNEALHLLGQLDAFVARCECDVVVHSEPFGTTYRTYHSTDHYVVVSPTAGRMADPSIIRLVGPSVSRQIGGKPLIVIPAVPSLSGDARYQVARPPAILGYHGFTAVEPVKNHAPRVLKMAFNGLIYTNAVRDGNATEPS